MASVAAAGRRRALRVTLSTWCRVDVMVVTAAGSSSMTLKQHRHTDDRVVPVHDQIGACHPPLVRAAPEATPPAGRLAACTSMAPFDERGSASARSPPSPLPVSRRSSACPCTRRRAAVLAQTLLLCRFPFRVIDPPQVIVSLVWWSAAIGIREAAFVKRATHERRHVLPRPLQASGALAGHEYTSLLASSSAVTRAPRQRPRSRRGTRDSRVPPRTSC
jgi:hypothetical protein